jgi:nucleotide-binding universal stress UspA family protein
MNRSILVPLDGSPFGEHALPLALAIAQQARARLRLAHVHVAPVPVYTAGELPCDLELDSTLKKHERAYLDEVKLRLPRSSSVAVSTALVEGIPVADALVREVQAAGADLVVMTTHGRGPLIRLWLGSIADELVRQCPVPLLLVRPQEWEPDLTRLPAVAHVLVPLDGTPLAERILGPAVALGTAADAGFTLLRVIKPALRYNYDLAGNPVNVYSQVVLQQLELMQRQVRAEAETYLEKVAGRLRVKGLRVHTRVVSHEQPAVAILEEALAHDHALIALETHGRHGLARLFLGSVADKVIRGASSPILVHRPLPVLAAEPAETTAGDTSTQPQRQPTTEEEEHELFSPSTSS